MITSLKKKNYPKNAVIFWGNYLKVCEGNWPSELNFHDFFHLRVSFIDKNNKNLIETRKFSIIKIKYNCVKNGVNAITLLPRELSTLTEFNPIKQIKVYVTVMVLVIAFK